MSDEAYMEDDRPQESDIPETGAAGRVEEISMSDLLDLSDPEEMDAFADEIDPDLLPDFVDSDGSEMMRFASDPDVLDDLTGRQQITSGTEQLLGGLQEHTGQSPQTSAGDVDAQWDYDQQSGEESVGGSVATPEQNIVDELGEAAGLDYADDEPLNTEDRLAMRDENRWELNAASALTEDTLEQTELDEGDIEEEDVEDEDAELTEDEDLLDELVFNDDDEIE